MTSCLYIIRVVSREHCVLRHRPILTRPITSLTNANILMTHSHADVVYRSPVILAYFLLIKQLPVADWQATTSFLHHNPSVSPKCFCMYPWYEVYWQPDVCCHGYKEYSLTSSLSGSWWRNFHNALFRPDRKQKLLNFGKKRLSSSLKGSIADFEMKYPSRLNFVLPRQLNLTKCWH